MREVAQAAGLGKSSLFHHFESKAVLYGDVLGRVLSRIRERVDPILRSGLGPAVVLERTVCELIDALAEQSNTARLLLRSLFEEDEFDDDPPRSVVAAEALLAELLDRLRGVLEDGIAQGVFRRVSVPDTMQTLIGAIVYHFASGEIGEGILRAPLFSAESVARRKRELTGLIRAGLLVREQRA
jgi:AcrR family transcriptional regulator